MSYRPMVEVSGEPGKFHGNGLRFATREEAEASARNLQSRWLLVVAIQVDESEDPVNYRWLEKGPNHLEVVG